MKLFGNRRRKAPAQRQLTDQTTDTAPNDAEPIPASGSGKKRTRLSGVQRGLLILAASIAILALECFGIYKFYVRPPEPVKPNISMADDPNGDQSTARRPNKVTTLDPETGEELEVELETPGDHKDGYYNILLVGTDDDGTRTDTIIVARLDTNDHSVALLSVPRDTYINANYDVPKINGAFGVGGKGEDGMELLKKYLKGILGFDVDGYVMVDLEAFVKTVDLIGGVEFNVPRNMYYSDPTQDLYINLSAGLQKLDGQHAMQLVRYRSYAQADIERINVQQQFLAATAKQCLTLSNLKKVKGFIEIFNEYVSTDLSVGNMIYFAQELVKCDFDEIERFTLPGEGRYIGRGSYYVLYPNQVLEMINEHFNPYETDIPAGNLQIRAVSGGGGSQSSGSSSAVTSQKPSEPEEEQGQSPLPEDPAQPEEPEQPPEEQTPSGPQPGDIQNPLTEPGVDEPDELPDLNGETPPDTDTQPEQPA